MSALKSPNINATPDDPVEMWGFEGILAAIDRGSLQHWHRIIVAVRRDPERPVALIQPTWWKSPKTWVWWHGCAGSSRR